MTNRIPRIQLARLVAVIVAVTGVLAVCGPVQGAQVRWHAPRLLGLVHHHPNVLRHRARRPSSRHTRPSPARVSAAGYVGTHNLVWHNGAVMHANHVHVIFWTPTDTRPGPHSYTFAANYRSIITNYLTNVAHDSGSKLNVFSTVTQYTDGSGSASYSSSFSAGLDLAATTDTLPPQQCTPVAPSTACLTDRQQEQEISLVRTAHGWPTGLGDIYFILTPANIDTCAGAGAPSPSNSCSSNAYCAYHSSFLDGGGHEILYATQPFPASGCDTGQRPNSLGVGGDPYADYAINTMSHEHNETVTDPDGQGWFVTSTGSSDDGNENGDQCNFTFGSPTGGISGSQWNQTINAAHYWLQGEWSNADRGCAYSFDLPPTISSLTFAPQRAVPGQSVSFATAATDQDGSVAGYSWDFGDGSAPASGPSLTQTSHAYAAGGTYTLRLTVTDNAGRASTQTRSIPVDSPPSCQPSGGSGASGATVVFALSCSDPDPGDPLSYSLVSQPAHGSVVSLDASSGTVAYRPQPGFSGQDGFAFTATDSAGLSAGPAGASVLIWAPQLPALFPPPAPRDPSTLLTSLRLTGPVYSSGRRRSSKRVRAAYSLAEPGTITAYLQRRRSGQRLRGRCVAPAAHRKRRGRSCTLLVRVASSVHHHNSAGSNSFALATILGKRTIAAASYSLVVGFRGDDGVATSRSVALRVR